VRERWQLGREGGQRLADRVEPPPVALVAEGQDARLCPRPGIVARRQLSRCRGRTISQNPSGRHFRRSCQDRAQVRLSLAFLPPFVPNPINRFARLPHGNSRGLALGTTGGHPPEPHGHCRFPVRSDVAPRICFSDLPRGPAIARQPGKANKGATMMQIQIDQRVQ